MVTVPVLKPSTIPELFTGAIAALLLVHAPPETVSVKVLVPPTHIVVEPPIVPAFAVGLTVTGNVAFTVPQLLVTL